MTEAKVLADFSFLFLIFALLIGGILLANLVAIRAINRKLEDIHRRLDGESARIDYLVEVVWGMK